VWATGTKCAVRVSKDDYDRQVLQAIASGERLTQRAIAHRLGVALGLTNVVIARLIERRCIEMSRSGRRDVRYLVTAAGERELAQARRHSLQHAVQRYTEAREQIHAALSSVSAACERSGAGKHVVFYGASDLAEIAYASLQRTDLTLVGVVDEQRRGALFGFTIVGSAHLSGATLSGIPYSHVVVTTVENPHDVAVRLAALAVPEERICWL
jgi:DNA-binding MarR family transcriptional regulator